MTNVFGLNRWTWMALTGSKKSDDLKMSTGKVYKQAIRRVFAKKYQDELMAVLGTRGRRDPRNYHSETLRAQKSLARTRTRLNSLVALVIALLSR